MPLCAACSEYLKDLCSARIYMSAKQLLQRSGKGDLAPVLWKGLLTRHKWGNMSAYANANWDTHGFPFASRVRTRIVSANLEQLLQRSQVDDPLVAEALVQQYYAYVYRLALSVLNDPDEAEDATQETFISAILNLERYRGESSLKTWLYAIALNTCRGHLRKRKARHTMRKAWQGLQSIVAKPFTPEEAAAQSESHRLLWEAVDDLGDKQRIPVILRYAHDLTVPEIAEILGISEGTVHSRLHYARRKLHGYLSHADILSNRERPKS
jgi:RNA polymerase sigma-70 factor (ECF subfamily)